MDSEGGKGQGSFSNPFGRPTMAHTGAALAASSFMPSGKTLKGILAGKF